MMILHLTCLCLIVLTRLRHLLPREPTQHLSPSVSSEGLVTMSQSTVEADMIFDRLGFACDVLYVSNLQHVIIWTNRRYWSPIGILINAVCLQHVLVELVFALTEGRFSKSPAVLEDVSIAPLTKDPRAAAIAATMKPLPACKGAISKALSKPRKLGSDE